MRATIAVVATMLASEAWPSLVRKKALVYIFGPLEKAVSVLLRRMQAACQNPQATEKYALIALSTILHLAPIAKHWGKLLYVGHKFNVTDLLRE